MDICIQVLLSLKKQIITVVAFHCKRDLATPIPIASDLHIKNIKPIASTSSSYRSMLDLASVSVQVADHYI